MGLTPVDANYDIRSARAPRNAPPPRVGNTSTPIDRSPLTIKWANVVSTMAQRRMADNAMIRRMVVIRDHANNDVTIPLPDVAEEPNLSMLIPGLIYDGIEGTAMQAAGPMPTIRVPALDQSRDQGPRSREYAAIRRRALYGRWHTNRLPLLLRRAYRQLCGYGSMAMVACPYGAEDKPGARIEYRDALTAYPEPRAAEDMRPPSNVGFVFGRSADWIHEHYPEADMLLARSLPAGNRQQQLFNGLWDLVEWIDEEHVLIGILGPRNLYATSVSRPVDIVVHQASGMLLRAWPNRAGYCTAVVPRRVTLDRIAGQLDNIVPIVDWMARFMALDTIASEKYIFPDLVAIGEPNQEPRIISGNGEWQDGRTGKINLLAGVKDVKALQETPGAATKESMQMLERAARITGGSSQLFGGDTQGLGQPRTGRAIDAIGSFSIDPRVQELQTIMGYALTDLNKAVIAVEKGYWPTQKFVVFSGWPSDEGHVEYTPAKHFEDDENVVTYVFPGTDMSQITVAISQLAGANLISKRTARDKHPFIEDPEMEDAQVTQEQLHDAMLLSIQKQTEAGQIRPEALAQILTELKGGTPMDQAIIKIGEQEARRQQEELAKAQQQQAGAGQPPGPGGGEAPGPGGLGGEQQLQQQLANAQQPQPPLPERNLAELIKTVSAPPRYARMTMGPGNPTTG